MEVEELCLMQEEANTRMLLHAHHIAEQKYQSIMISSMDTDVRILCIAFCKDMSDNIYRSGTDARTTFGDICAATATLGVNICRSLIGLHSFTGCDITIVLLPERKNICNQGIEKKPSCIVTS